MDAAAHGADIVLTLWRTPRWARADGGRGGKPNLYSWAPRISDWRAFVYAAAVRYSGSFDPDGPEGYGGPLPLVRFWEMWNEPNYIGALRPQRKAGKPDLADDLHRHAERRLRRDRPRRARAQASSWTCSAAAMNRGFGGEGSVAPLIFLRGMKKASATLRHRQPAPVPADRPGRLRRRHAGAEHHAGQHRRLPARSSTGSGRPSATGCG